jgi:hypothetical protein
LTSLADPAEDWVALPAANPVPRVSLNLSLLRDLAAGHGPDRERALHEADQMIGPNAVSAMLEAAAASKRPPGVSVAVARFRAVGPSMTPK